MRFFHFSSCIVSFLILSENKKQEDGGFIKIQKQNEKRDDAGRDFNPFWARTRGRKTAASLRLKNKDNAGRELDTGRRRDSEWEETRRGLTRSFRASARRVIHIDDISGQKSLQQFYYDQDKKMPASSGAKEAHERNEAPNFFWPFSLDLRFSSREIFGRMQTLSSSSGLNLTRSFLFSFDTVVAWFLRSCSLTMDALFAVEELIVSFMIKWAEPSGNKKTVEHFQISCTKIESCRTFKFQIEIQIP